VSSQMRRRYLLRGQWGRWWRPLPISSRYPYQVILVRSIPFQDLPPDILLTGGYSSGFLLNFLDCLLTNRTLADLDLRGNGGGDTLLFHVAKLLKYNSSLLSLYLDENDTTDKGWQVRDLISPAFFFFLFFFESFFIIFFFLFAYECAGNIFRFAVDKSFIAKYRYLSLSSFPFVSHVL
jgi:hypothetical protein